MTASPDLRAVEASDRYRAVGLARNPFAVSSLAPTSDAFVCRGLAAPPPPGSGVLVQVIGEAGSGKSAQLRRWQATVPAPYHYVVAAPYRRRWSRPAVADLVYGDEIDRLPWPLRRRWLGRLGRRGATVAIATHTDLGDEARRAGLAVVTNRLEPVDRATLAAILDARLESVALDRTVSARRASSSSPTSSGRFAPTSRFAFSGAEVTAIHAKANGSIREAETLAHELLAERVLEPLDAVSAELR